MAQVEANLQQTYFFIINYPYTVFLKLTTPEVFEFDMEEIKTRGYGLTVSEATAIRYWGEENNTADKQDIVWLLAGHFFNVWTFQFLAPQSPTFIKVVLDFLWEFLNTYFPDLVFIATIIFLPLVFVYLIIYVISIFAYAFYVFTVLLPSLFL